MLISKDYNFQQIFYSCWGDAIDTLKVIAGSYKEDMFMTWITEYFQYVPTIVEINDFLKTQNDYIFSELGITPNNDDEE